MRYDVNRNERQRSAIRRHSADGWRLYLWSRVWDILQLSFFLSTLDSSVNDFYGSGNFAIPSRRG